MTATQMVYTDAGVPRDQWTRPLIVPLDGGEPVPYTRASTLAKALDKGEALTKWKQRQTAVGLAQRPDLLALVQSQLAAPDNKKLDLICEDALVAAGSESGANMGTALHTFTEHIDQGIEVQGTPAVMADLAAYQRTMSGLKVVSREVFVVVDRLRVAGSLDKIVEWDGQLVVADVKTGQREPDYPHSCGIQMAIYAHGTPYGQGPGRADKTLAQMGVSQGVGLMIHLPAGQARCDLYEVPLEQAWQMARVAVGVRSWFATDPLKKVTG